MVSAMAVAAQRAHVYDQVSGYLAGETAVVSVVAEAAVVAEGWWACCLGWSFGFLRDKERLHR